MRYDYANGMNRGEYSYDESNEYSGYDNRYAEQIGRASCRERVSSPV